MVLPDSEYIQTDFISELNFFKKMGYTLLRGQVRTGQRIRDCCNETINPYLHFPTFLHKDRVLEAQLAPLGEILQGCFGCFKSQLLSRLSCKYKGRHF